MEHFSTRLIKNEYSFENMYKNYKTLKTSIVELQLQCSDL